MISQEFEELSKKRVGWVDSSKENGFDFNDILAGAYDDPSHFIFEILQNADDESATQVKFELKKEGIDIYHDGKDFEIKDVEGVTGIGNSKKKTDLTSIGKFGVGFKSVFAITTTPYIFSGAFNFMIVNFVVPKIMDNPNFDKGTLIRLPFNHTQRSPEELYVTVSRKLGSLGLKTLLFLKNVEKISYKDQDFETEFTKSTERTGMENAKITVLRSALATEKYLVFNKDFTLRENKMRVEVAFKLGTNKSGRMSIVKETDTRLIVYMPTETPTYLDFIIQGPFRTTPNRANVPLDDPDNQIILEKIGDLVSESLMSVKEMGYFDSDFLEVLPIAIEPLTKSKIYSIIFQRVRDRLQKESILPTSGGGFGKAEDVLLSRGKELIEFLNQEDIGLLFGKKYWLDTSITYDRTRNLRDYLINELNIQEVDFENFARKINVEFLRTKSDNWMIEFYSRLLEQESLWGKNTSQKGFLRSRPIIRLENDDHIAPFDENGRDLAYLPVDVKSEYKTVKRSIAENEDAHKFLMALGLTRPDELAEIRTFIIPRYSGEPKIDYSNYVDDFEKLLLHYEGIKQTEKAQYLSELKDLKFIQCVSNKGRALKFCKPYDVYFPSEDLEDYFAFTDDTHFVSEQLMENFKRESFSNFLVELGVSSYPRRIEIKGSISSQEKTKCGAISISRFFYDKDYELDGLDNFLKSINVDNSILLWKLISKCIGNMNNLQAKEFFNAEFSWFWYERHICKYTPVFIKKLRSSQWIVRKDNSLVKPSEIMFSETSEKYENDFGNVDILKEVLGFKPEIPSTLPEDMRKRLEIVNDIPIDILENLVNNFKHNTADGSIGEWVHDVEPSEPSVNILNIELAQNEPPHISTFEKSDHPDQDTGETNPNQRIMLDPKKKKAIGKWGEEFVFNALKKNYGMTNDVKIIWLNEKGEYGKGYDIVIEKEGNVEEFVEVKTKTQEGDELIEVTGTQWETARTLFEQGLGDRYSICVVHNPGSMNATIERILNPFKLWREGKLFAHPVNLRL